MHETPIAEPQIVIRDLTVRYGQIVAVQHLNLSIAQGEIFGILGPNGAGKSSTLACILGLVQPAAGDVIVGGHHVRTATEQAKALLGVQLQRSALFAELTALELVRMYAALYDQYPTRTAALALLGRFGLAEKAHIRPRKLSGGQQQRLALALALVNNPPIVVFDEPTGALDPQARRAVWREIQRLRSERHTILLTTHSMEEAELLCDRLAIIDAGQLVVLGTPTELIAQYAPPLHPEEAARRKPNLEDVFLAMTGRSLGSRETLVDEDQAWLTGSAS